jgi:2-C-methyl-D-erythritol 2,4-cyclodiphosphate synthase
MRIGHGFDAHRFGAGDHLLLAGVKVACEFGIVAHSDGDVILHALIDALLGAAALGSIGEWFPDSDPNLRGIASSKMLERVYVAVKQKNLHIINCDITVIAETPRIQPQVALMRESLSQLLALPTSAINIKGKTTEKMGYTGRKEGIACHCVLLLQFGS